MNAAVLADPPSDPYQSDVDAMLRNWGVWSRMRTGGVACCGSAERWYRAPQHWWPEGPRLSADELSALKVERCMRQVPRDHRKALFLLYVARADAQFCCLRLRLPRAMWDRFIEDARRMVANVLKRAKHGASPIENASRRTI